jgi:anti-sigma B factor antagonist
VDTDALTMSVATRGRVCRIGLTGDVTAVTGTRLSQAVHAAVRDGAVSVELDMTGVKFLDSSGIQSLIRSREVAAQDFQSRVTVVAMSRLVQRVLDVTGLADVLADDGTA